MKTILVEIGNTDNKLTQQHWARFCSDVAKYVGRYAEQIYTSAYSLPNAEWQNACWHFEISDDGIAPLRLWLQRFCKNYHQQGIMWSETSSTMLEPEK